MIRWMLIILAVIVLIGIVFSVHYLFNYAIVRGNKPFINSVDTEQLSKEWNFAEGSIIQVKMHNHEGLELSGRQVKHKLGQKKLAIIVHGYNGTGEQMGQYAELFYREGFDILAPDNRAHGNSEGKYIGFGWLDRLDYVQWIQKMIQQYGEDVEIVLFGLSMGAATVMMLSGENLPPQVKAIVSDCGYESVDKQLSYQLKEMFHVPSIPIVPLTSMYSKLRAGYSFKEASAINQLKRNTRPILFIHGDQDDFVPFSAVHQVYEATNAPKRLVVVEGAEHAQSLKVNRTQYKKEIHAFLDTYGLSGLSNR